MSIAELPAVKLMTAREFMEIPEDGISRELIDGQVRELGMSLRNRKHGRVVTRVSYLLESWNDRQPEPRGLVHSGDAGFLLRSDPDVMVGADVGYASAELVARTDPSLAYHDGPPLLAVEVLSPSDRLEAVVEKIDRYLESGAIVWLVNPDFRIVTVHRPGHPVESFDVLRELSADPYLPGFRVVVAKFFEG